MARATPRNEEREFQSTVEALLDVFGYEHIHTYPLQTKHGWRTPTTTVGWPDVVAVRPPRLLAIEIKSDAGRLDEAQRAWLSLTSRVPSARAWVLRPRDPWDDIAGWVRRPKLAPAVYGFEPIPDDLTCRRVIAEAKRRRGRR